MHDHDIIPPGLRPLQPLFFYKSHAIGRAHLTTVPTNTLAVDALVAGSEAYWIATAGIVEKWKRRTLILTDWALFIENRQTIVEKMVRDWLEAGFLIWVWQQDGLYPLTDLQCWDQVVAAIHPVSESRLQEALVKQHFVADEILLLDYFVCTALSEHWPFFFYLDLTLINALSWQQLQTYSNFFSLLDYWQTCTVLRIDAVIEWEQRACFQAVLQRLSRLARVLIRASVFQERPDAIRYVQTCLADFPELSLQLEYASPEASAFFLNVWCSQAAYPPLTVVGTDDNSFQVDIHTDSSLAQIGIPAVSTHAICYQGIGWTLPSVMPVTMRTQVHALFFESAIAYLMEMPSLKTLRLGKQVTYGASSTEMTARHYPQLTRLYSECQDDRVLQWLLNKTPNLQWLLLEVGHYVPASVLPQLTLLSIPRGDINTLLSWAACTPNLRQLTIAHFTTVSAETNPHTMTAWSLLEILIIEQYDGYDVADIVHLLHYMPNIRHIQLRGYCGEQDGIWDAMTKAITKIAPRLVTLSVGKKLFGMCLSKGTALYQQLGGHLTTHSTQHRRQRLDTETAWRNTTVTVRQIFTAIGQNTTAIPECYYRCRLFHTLDLSGSDIQWCSANPEPCLPSRVPLIREAWLTDAALESSVHDQPHHFVGRVSLTLSSNVWTLLPSLQADERLKEIHCSATPGVSIELGYSENYPGFHLLRASRKITIDLQWIVSLPNGWQNPQSFIVDPAIRTLQHALLAYGAGEINVASARTAAEKLALLEKEQKGACRHRAAVCLKRLQEMGIVAYVIANDCHAFVLFRNPAWGALSEAREWIMMDVGGYPAALHYVPPPSLPAVSAAPASGITETRYTLFSHQLTSPLPFAAYLSALMQMPESCILFALPTVDQKTLFLNVLMQETTRSGQLWFIADKPADLRCAVSRLCLVGDRGVRGELRSPASPLWDFFQRVAERPAILCIDWTHFSAADIVRCQTMLDTRTVDGYALPTQLTIMSCGEVGFLKQRDQSFHSRHQKKILCPYTTDELYAYISEEKVMPVSDPVYIALYDSVIDWEKLLIGQWQLQGDTFTFRMGPLLQAIEQQCTLIVLQQAPSHWVEFQRFWDRLLRTRQLTVYGRTYDLPRACRIVQQALPYAWESWVSCIHRCMTTQQVPVATDWWPLNGATFSQLFERYRLVDQRLYTDPGLLMMSGHEPLCLYVTHPLAEDQWARFLSEATRVGKRLNLLLAPGVYLPRELRILSTVSEAKDDSGVRELTYETAEIIATDDIDLSVQQLLERDPDAEVIAVNSQRFSAFFCSLQRVEKATDFLFSESFSESFHVLQTGGVLIVQGQLTVDIVQQYASLFLPSGYLQTLQGRFSWKGKLFWVTDQDPSDFQGLSYRVKRHAMKCSYAHQLLARQGVAVALALEQLHVPQPMTLSAVQEALAWASGADSIAQVNTSRITAILALLEKMPWVCLIGPTGSGKTTLMQDVWSVYTGDQVHHGHENVMAWLESKPHPTERSILCLDEMNLTAEAFEFLRTLWLAYGDVSSEKNPTIWFNGKRYVLTRAHKVIFVGNPVGYGGGRVIQACLLAYPVVIPIPPLPHAYVYYQIVQPILKRVMNDAPCLESVGKILLAVWQFFQVQDIVISGRELQTMALYWVVRQPTRMNAEAIAYDVAKYMASSLLQTERQRDAWQAWLCDRGQSVEYLSRAADPIPELQQFVVTPTREFLYRDLRDFLRIRDLRLTGQIAQHEAPGLCGYSLVGPPGIGKTIFVQAVLEQMGLQKIAWHALASLTVGQSHFCVLPLTLSVALQQTVLESAFHKGVIVIIDEFNTTLLEGTLNPLLMGKLRGRPADYPGCVFICTGNSIGLSGRAQISSALEGRFKRCTVPDYPDAEIVSLLCAYGCTLAYAETLLHLRETEGLTVRDLLQRVDTHSVESPVLGYLDSMI